MAVVKTNRSCTRSPIVSIEVKRVDPREAEARNLIMWFKTVPSGAINPCLATTFALHLGEMRAVDRLKSLVVKDLDIVAPGVAPNFLRVKTIDGTDGVPMYVVGYMEYMAATDAYEEHFSSMCTQHYTHIVDAFKCLQLRLESEHPYKSVRI
jgi:hypothetical protein